MKISHLVMFAALAPLIGAVRGVAATDIAGVYAAQCDAIHRGDWAAFTNSLAPDYVGTNLNGPPDTRASEATDIRQMMDQLGLTRCDVKINSVNPGESGKQIVDVDFSFYGIAPKDLGKHVKQGDRIELRFHSIDTWEAGNPLLQAKAETKGVQTLINGVVIVSSGRSDKA